MGTSQTKQEKANEIVDKSTTDTEIDNSWNVVNLHMNSFLSGVLAIMLVLLCSCGIIFFLNHIRKKWIVKRNKYRKTKITSNSVNPWSLEMSPLQLHEVLNSQARTMANFPSQHRCCQDTQEHLEHRNNINMKKVDCTDQYSQVPGERL